MAEIRNILFDLGNVIIDIDIPGARQRLYALLHPDTDPDAATHALTDLVHAYEINTISTDDFIDGTLQLARPGVTSADVISAWNSMIVGIPAYRLGMLDALRRGFTVIGLSNTNALHIARVHEYLQQVHDVTHFEKAYFHTMYYSHEIRARKPDAAAFQYVIDDAYITPAHTLFIDDMAENIRTARKMGFRVWRSPAEEEIATVLKVKRFIKIHSQHDATRKINTSGNTLQNPIILCCP